MQFSSLPSGGQHGRSAADDEMPFESGDPVAIDLNVDAALLLQRLAGIDAYPLVLDLWPTIHRQEDQDRVDAVVTEQLVAAGILTDDRIHPAVEQWLRCLDRPDVELVARIWDPGPEPDPEAMLRLSLVRAGSRHVLAVRCGDHLVLQPVFGADERLDTLTVALLAALGPAAARQFSPFRAAQDEVVLMPVDPAEAQQVLLELGAPAHTAAILSRVTLELVRRAEVLVVAHESGTTPIPEFGLDILDTPAGRLMVMPSRDLDGRMSVTYLPGDDAAVRAGVRALVELLPGGSWFDHSRT